MTTITKIITWIILTQLIQSPYNIAYSNFSKKNTWYMGNKIGLSQYNDIITYINEIITCNNDIYDSIHNSHTAFGTFIGYQTDQYFGFELSYNYLGKITYTNEAIHSSFKVQSVDISTRLYHPVTNNTNIYTKLGGSIWHANIKNVYHNNYNTSNYHIFNINDTSISPFWGLGIEHVIKKQWTTRLEYQKINNVGNINTIGAKSNHTMLNLSILYYFL